jgi:hypothetical protein
MRCNPTPPDCSALLLKQFAHRIDNKAFSHSLIIVL